MRKIALLAMFVAVIAGCATVNKQAIDAKSATSLKNQTITHTVRKKPDFAAMTAGKATFAVLGAVAMISAGNDIIQKNNVSDPADAIAIGLAKTLEESHGSRLVMPPIMVSTDDAAQVAATTNGAAKFVVDVQTINWSFGYFPTDWSHYRVIYTAKARLIDSETKIVVAEGFCKRIPDTNTNAPTNDELLANEASLLKKELSTAADECVKSLKGEMLSL